MEIKVKTSFYTGDDAMETQNLDIKQKAELVAKLTLEIVNEAKSDSFINKSENNERISGLMRTFGNDYYINYTNQLNRIIQDTD